MCQSIQFRTGNKDDGHREVLRERYFVLLMNTLKFLSDWLGNRAVFSPFRCDIPQHTP